MIPSSDDSVNHAALLNGRVKKDPSGKEVENLRGIVKIKIKNYPMHEECCSLLP